MRMDIQCFQSILSLMNISFDPATDWALKFLEPDAEFVAFFELGFFFVF